jgi:Uma2 family endonuclease
MEWADVIQDSTLQNLPFKVELNEHGTIMMTPASNRHGRLQGRIYKQLTDITSEGDAMVECSVDTPKGVKVADVAWFSDAFLAQHGETTPYPEAPELCVEVVSPSNSRREMKEKVELYLTQGAKEVWLCSEQGQVEFFGVNGSMEESSLFPTFPTRL